MRRPRPIDPHAATAETAATLRPAAGVRAAGGDDGLVLLDLDSGRYFALNAVGGRVWRRLEAGASQAETAAALAEELSAPLAVVRRDVAELVAVLAGRGLVVPASVPAEPRPRPAPTAAAAARAPAGGRPGAALVATAWSTLVGLDLALRLGDFGHCLRRLGAVPTVAVRRTDLVGRVVAAVDRAAALYFKRAWCLQRSAACVRMLRRRGVPARLVLGVRPMPFYAHAWAEVDGRVVNDGAWVCELAVLERF